MVDCQKANKAARDRALLLVGFAGAFCRSELVSIQCQHLAMQDGGIEILLRPQLRAAFVINRRVVGTVIGRDARSAVADQPFPALNTEVSQRIVFADNFSCSAASNTTRSGASRVARTLMHRPGAGA